MRAFKKFILTGGKIVEAYNHFAIIQKAVNKVATDETRRAGNKYLFH
jgi:hypothetical protein